MSKSTFLNNSKLNKSNIAFLCILGMMMGFLVNNIVLSIFTIFFCINSLRDINPRLWPQNKYWIWGVAWLAAFAISYFWSSDKAIWERSFQVKFPLFLFPLAFSFLPPFTARQLERLTIYMGAMLMIGVAYSLSFLVLHYDKYLLEYKWSVLLPTPCSQDHVRFSMGVALYCIWGLFMWPWYASRTTKWIMGAMMAALVIYLHILAAKSGLMALYVFATAWGIYIAMGKNKLVGVAVIIAIPLFLFLAARFIPTFKERKDYIGYAWTMLREGDRSGNYGDVNRLMSYKLALEIIAHHPLTGVGSGDMLREMKKGYDKYYPQVDDKARLLPHNQFLLVGVGCGLPAMLLFMVWVGYPLTWIKRNRQGFFLFMVWLLLLSQLMIEPVLEVQNGVFLYLFFLLWQKQKMPA